MEIISASHVDVKDKVLNPDPRVCRSVVCLYVHGFEYLWKIVIQHLVSESKRVCSPSVSGHVTTCCLLLLRPVLILNWYSISVIVLVTIIPRRSISSGSVDGPGCTDFLIQMLTQIVRGVSSRSVVVMKRYVWSPGCIILLWNGLVVEFWQ